MLRINVQAFVSDIATAELIRSAFNDRRLNRAALRLFQGGLAEATTLYGRETSPPLIIVELADPGAALGQLDALAEVCEAGTQLIALGKSNDVDIYRALRRRGVADYLVVPCEPLQLIDTIEGLFAAPDAAPKGKVFAFLGARGGTGSSTIAHNTAFALTEGVESEVIVIDLDLAFGSADIGFNRDAPQGVRQALADPSRLDELLLQRYMVGYGDRLKLLAAPPSLESDHNIPLGSLELLVDVARRSAPFVVLDLPHVWSEWVRYALALCDDVVLTATPDLICLRNARNLIDYMNQKRRNDRAPFLVVNQIGAAKRTDIALKDFGNAVGLAPMLALDADPQLFGKAANSGQMVLEVGRRTKAAEAFRTLAGKLSGREAASKKQPSFGFLKSKKAAGRK